jgi:hypothetical protein
VTAGRPAFVLDGDNLRHGLNGDLGFDEAARCENVRRTAHVARLLAESGTIALVSLVSPYARDREEAIAIHAAVDLPLPPSTFATGLDEWPAHGTGVENSGLQHFAVNLVTDLGGALPVTIEQLFAVPKPIPPVLVKPAPVPRRITLLRVSPRRFFQIVR